MKKKVVTKSPSSTEADKGDAAEGDQHADTGAAKSEDEALPASSSSDAAASPTATKVVVKKKKEPASPVIEASSTRSESLDKLMASLQVRYFRRFDLLSHSFIFVVLLGAQ